MIYDSEDISETYTQQNTLYIYILEFEKKNQITNSFPYICNFLIFQFLNIHWPSNIIRNN